MHLKAVIVSSLKYCFFVLEECKELEKDNHGKLYRLR